MRTTLNIDDAILRDLKRLQHQQGKSLDRLVSDLLAQSLQAHPVADSREPALQWVAKPMGVRIDPADRHVLLDAAD